MEHAPILRSSSMGSARLAVLAQGELGTIESEALVMASTPSARDISEQILNTTGRAILKRDFDAFKTCFAYPLTTETFEGQQVIRTEPEFLRVFTAAHEYYRMRNVTDLVRRVVTAEFKDAGVIHSLHESRLLSGHEVLDQRTDCFSRLRLIDGEWRIDLTRYVNTNARQLDQILGGTLRKVTAGQPDDL